MTRKASSRFITLFAILAVLVLVPAALADKGGSGKGGSNGASGSASSLSLAMVTDSNSNGLPNWGDQVTFNVSTTATTSPYVVVNCSQGGSSVYSDYAGAYAGFPWPQTFTLSSVGWTGGAASCTATLEYYSGSKVVTATSLSFDVGA